MAAGACEFGEKLGMAGMAEAGAVEDALGNRIGDDRAGPTGDHVADGLANRGHGGGGAGVVRLARPRGRRLAGSDDGQRVRKYIERILGTSVGEFDVQSESLRPIAEEVA